MTPGIYPDLPNEAYHKSSGISKTGLCRLDRSPKTYREFMDHPRLSKKSRSLELGSIFHIAMEGALDRDCAVGPEVKDKRQKEWKDFVEANPGKICLTPGEAAAVRAMREAMLSFGPAREILAEPGSFEVSYYWEDLETGLLCKCRPDWISENNLTITDFKTAQDVTEAAFVRAADRYHYHVSAAMTMDGVHRATGIKPLRYIFLAIESQSPYLVAAYEATADDIARGRAFVRRSLTTLKQCMDRGTWPGLPEEIKPLDVGRFSRWREDEGKESEEIDSVHAQPEKEWWK
jgi:exodeoxyribonuclease VIII